MTDKIENKEKHETEHIACDDHNGIGSCGKSEHSHENGISCSCGCHGINHGENCKDGGGEEEMSLRKILAAAAIFAAAMLASHIPAVKNLEKTSGIAPGGTNIVSMILMFLF